MMLLFLLLFLILTPAPERTMRRAVTRVTACGGDSAASYRPRLQPHVPRSPPAGGFCRRGGHLPYPQSTGGKNGGNGPNTTGPARARCIRVRSRKMGSRGVPGRTPCRPLGGKCIVRLYRPDKPHAKCPALLAGAGAFLVGGETAAEPACRFQQHLPCGGFRMAGRYVKVPPSTVHLPLQRKESCVMPYAIMRFEKRKGEPASAIEKHHERKKPRYASNP